MTANITIIVPVYKAEKHIHKCLDSLVNQTLRNIEIICINDGSPDNSLAILKQYAKKDSRIIVLNQINAGPSSARNHGLKVASGEYILFCDSDDFLDLNTCELMYTTIIEKKVDMVICDFHFIKENLEYNRPGLEWHCLNQFGFYRLTQKNMSQVHWVLCNKLYKNSVIKNNHIQFPLNCAHEDLSFVGQYLCVTQTIYGLDRKLYNYYLHSESTMHQAYSDKKNLLDRLNADQYIYDFLKARNLISEKNYYFFIDSFCSSIYWICQTFNDRKKAYETFVYANKILQQIDLDLYIDNDQTLILKNIKQKNYDALLDDLSLLLNQHDIQISNSKNKTKITKKIIQIIKSYLFWPYYIYRIYKTK